MGGRAVDFVEDSAVDSKGSIYLTGWTGSADFPVHAPVQRKYAGCIEFGCSDAFVMKLDPTGSKIIYSTFLGGGEGEGGGHDYGNAIAVDLAGNAYVAGTTFSSDFPTTEGAFKEELTSGDQVDAFVAKLGPSGSLEYSTLLGGGLGGRNAGGNIAGDDEGNDIDVDPEGRVVVTGRTDSRDFPLRHPVQPALAGATDAFVSMLDESGRELLFSTYLGGESEDVGNALQLGSPGTIFVGGETESASFPTKNALQPANGSTGTTADDGFVTKIDLDTSEMTYSTFLGGTGNDEVAAISVDVPGAAHVAGTTDSSDFPTTDDAFQSRKAGNGDAFFATVSPSGEELQYASAFGGKRNDFATSVVAGESEMYLAGASASSTLPLRRAIQNRFAERYDAFAAGFGSKGRRLIWSTYIGGVKKAPVPLVDSATSINVIGRRILVVGVTRSPRLACCSGRRPPNRKTDIFILVAREVIAGR